jgi:hypothetical protein
MAVNHNGICNIRHVSAFTESHHKALKNTQSKEVTDVLKRLMVAVHIPLFYTLIRYTYGCDVMPSSFHYCLFITTDYHTKISPRHFI